MVVDVLYFKFEGIIFFNNLLFLVKFFILILFKVFDNLVCLICNLEINFFEILIFLVLFNCFLLLN